MKSKTYDQGSTSLASMCLCRLVPRALVVLGPPCSLFIWLSSSVHRRSLYRPDGDTSRLAVRLSNAISRNTVASLAARISVLENHTNMYQDVSRCIKKHQILSVSLSNSQYLLLFVHVCANPSLYFAIHVCDCGCVCYRGHFPTGSGGFETRCSNCDWATLRVVHVQASNVAPVGPRSSHVFPHNVDGPFRIKYAEAHEVVFQYAVSRLHYCDVVISYDMCCELLNLEIRWNMMQPEWTTSLVQ